jgi:hypothetical protein
MGSSGELPFSKARSRSTVDLVLTKQLLSHVGKYWARHRNSSSRMHSRPRVLKLPNRIHIAESARVPARASGIARLVRAAILILTFHPLLSPAQTPSPAPAPTPDPAVQKTQGAIDKLKKAVDASMQILNAATAAAVDLRSLLDPGTDRGDFDVRVQPLADKLSAIVKANVVQEITSRSGAINDAETALSGISSKCDRGVLGDAVADACNNGIDKANAQIDALKSAGDGLTDALKTVVPYLKASLADYTSKLTAIEPIWTDQNPVADDFAKSEPTYAKACSVYLYSKGQRDKIINPLKTLNADAASASGDVDAAITSLATELKTLAQKAAGIVGAIQKTADDNTKKVSDSITAVQATPVAAGQAASDAVTDANKAVNASNTVLAIWPDLEDKIKACGADRNQLASLRQSIEALRNSRKSLQEKLSALNDQLVGDPKQFTEEVVQLFFYTEVEKLMRSLNERTDWARGNSTAATVAASQRELLLDAEGRVSQARGEVADLQFELANLQEQQRQADAANSVLNLLSEKASLNKKESDSALRRATDDFNEAQDEAAADPTDAGKKTRLQKATDKKNQATAKAADAATKESDAKSKVADADAQQKAAASDKDSLAARIDLAKTKLADAQRNMEAMQRSAYRAALTESDAFAAARDQTPYLDAPALSTSPDPVKRVIMRGYPDRNLILLRGKPEDLAVVKRLIAGFDVPAPQARLTLWSFEISAEAGKGFLWIKKSADRLNEATAIVDDSLTKTRGDIAGAATSLRQSVNDAVSDAEMQGGAVFSTCANPPLPPSDEWSQLRPAERAKWLRFRFYSPAVLNQAGVDMTDIYSFRNAVLPDPAATTTVGEALVVLALSCKENRRRVFEHFRENAIHSRDCNCLGRKQGTRRALCFSGTAEVLQIEIDSMCNREPSKKSVETSGKNQERTKSSVDALAKKEDELDAKDRYLKEMASRLERDKLEFIEAADRACNSRVDKCQADLATAKASTPQTNQAADWPSPLLQEFANSRPQGLRENESISDTQLEIVRALRAGATKTVLWDMQGMRQLIKIAEADYNSFKKGKVFQALSDAEKNEARLKAAGVASLYNRYNGVVSRRFKILYPDQVDNFLLLPNRPDFAIRQESVSGYFSQLLNSQSSPRVAAADEMLKRMMGRLEDDLDVQYVQPMLKDLRTELLSKGLTVGIVQRTSVLATNRLKARVDPKGTYDLSVGEQQDLLASIGQLTNIYLTAQTGGALGAFGTLNSLNQKQEQRIYGVTTGNKFEVTPIFDPSGQALRFKFDYVSNSLIRNPQGSVDPTMPSIRHTINTEVQLSNLEIREISRYESNAKLGIPTKYWGGIPILADIPGFKPIPFIGWFVRHSGSNAEVQQSVIFGQTTIYPTIGSIVNLLQTGD